MSKQKTFGPHAWMHHEEMVASRKEIWIDIGIGEDLQRESGMSKRQIADVIVDHRDSLIQDGANIFDMVLGGRSVTFYTVSRKKHLEVGTRADMELLHWGSICDLLDAEKAKNHRGDK